MNIAIVGCGYVAGFYAALGELAGLRRVREEFGLPTVDVELFRTPRPDDQHRVAVAVGGDDPIVDLHGAHGAAAVEQIHDGELLSVNRTARSAERLRRAASSTGDDLRADRDRRLFRRAGADVEANRRHDARDLGFWDTGVAQPLEPAFIRPA